MRDTRWLIDHSPFRASLDPGRYVPTEPQEEVLARLQFLVEQKRRLGVLIGPSGSGKTLVLKVAREQLRRNGCDAQLINLHGLSGHELLWQIAVRLGGNPPLEASSLALWQMAGDALATRRYQRTATVLLCDDAGQAADGANETLARLVRGCDAEFPLTILLACTPEGVSRLGASLTDSCELRMDLPEWDLDETSRFVQARLAAGERELQQVGRGEDDFPPGWNPQAVARLHSLSQGSPRRICQLAELANVATLAQGETTVAAAALDAVYEELLGTRGANENDRLAATR